jgi:dTDP-4-dehydrorhamnose reductase
VFSVKVLIVGKTGQLACELLKNAPLETTVVALDRASLDLSDSIAIARVIRGSGAEVVVNAAAYTAVDLAESESSRAYAINDIAVGAMAQACAEVSARFVHVSTDFVFDGTAGKPYRPDSATNPLSVYGASKLAGEQRVAATSDLDWRIIRTAWVYSAAGKNFVLTMLRLFRERDVVRVVADQVGTPTSAPSLANCVWRAATDKGDSSILHFTDAGVASWYDFAVAIYEEARTIDLVTKPVQVVPIPSDEYPTAARRPAFSVLDTRDTLRRLGIVPVHWRIMLREVLQELKA